MGARYTLACLACLWALAACGDDAATETSEVVFSVTTLEVSPLSRTFDALPPGQSERLDVTLRHAGNAGTITLGTIRFDPPTDVFGLVQPADRELEPGQEARVRVVVTPAGWDDAHGRLTIAHDAPNQPSPLVVDLHVLQPAPQPVVSPAALGFGERDRCDTATLDLTLSVMSARPVTLRAAAMEPGCAPWVTLVDLPPLPVTVDADAPLTLHAAATPGDPGRFACDLVLTFAEAAVEPLRVPVTLTTAVPARTQEVFALAAPEAAQVLLVLDASRDGMAAQVERVVAGVEALVGRLPEDVPLRLGVMGVDPRDTCPEAGRLLGDPPWVDGEDRAAIPLRARALLEAGCDPSAREAPFDSLLAALGDDALADAETPCTSEADCEPPALCVAGGCGGPNRAFTGPAGVLHVVIVSDEDDQSAAQVSTVTERLLELKGDEPLRAFVHVAAGGAEGCQGDGWDALPAPRVLALAAQTSGVSADWCAPDWAAPLTEGPPAAVGALTVFVLQGTPVADTIEVWKNAEPCTEGWRYDATGNRIVVDAPGPCLPAPGDELRVSYVPACP